MTISGDHFYTELGALRTYCLQLLTSGESFSTQVARILVVPQASSLLKRYFRCIHPFILSREGSPSRHRFNDHLSLSVTPVFILPLCLYPPLRNTHIFFSGAARGPRWQLLAWASCCGLCHQAPEQPVWAYLKQLCRLSSLRCTLHHVHWHMDRDSEQERRDSGISPRCLWSTFLGASPSVHTGTPWEGGGGGGGVGGGGVAGVCVGPQKRESAPGV